MDSPLVNLDQLGDVAQTFARSILGTHPEWTLYARIERSGHTLSFVVELRPSRPDWPSVFIYADDDEITVAFDRWHAHFDTWAEIAEEEGPTDGRAVVEALLAEQLAVAVTMRGTEWAGSRTVQRSDSPPTPALGTHIYVRSWAGTLNSEHAAA
jgi:hypothetical protein